MALRRLVKIYMFKAGALLKVYERRGVQPILIANKEAVLGFEPQRNHLGFAAPKIDGVVRETC